MMTRKEQWFSYLFRWEGELDRLPYLITGTVLLGIKYNIDRAIAWFGFNRSWSLTEYFWPGKTIDVLLTSKGEQAFFGTLIAASLPFIWIGVVLTLRRMRAAKLPLWLVKLFFLPFVNLIMFLVLCLFPSRPEVDPFEKHQKEVQEQKEKEHWLHDASEGKLASAMKAILLPLPIAGLFIYFGVMTLKTYGWGIFLGVPFVQGMTSAMLYARSVKRGLWESILVGISAVSGLGFLLFLFAFEGVICLLMAAPIMLALGMMGALLGWALQKTNPQRAESVNIMLAISLSVPLLMGAEWAVLPEAPTFSVTTSVDIKAPPEVVWHNVVSFCKLPPPRDWLFKTGIAYPMYARIDGRGPGAIRHCVFSTGEFVEPITVWDEPRVLRFDVSAQPKAMRELAIVPDANPPHLDNYLLSKQGEFHLVRMPDGNTHLEGTTWYQHHMYPSEYWRMWSDFILHRIHKRVLDHVKVLSERENGRSEGFGIEPRRSL
ncbi:MAG TPA: SRPBCC family protein [Candidatus Obscuribacterales bacterium]